jgi:hypothetical protein
MFNDNFDFNRDYFNQFGRFIPFDFINQVIPVIFKVTGREILDVSLLAGPNPAPGQPAGPRAIIGEPVIAPLNNTEYNAANGIIPPPRGATTVTTKTDTTTVTLLPRFAAGHPTTHTTITTNITTSTTNTNCFVGWSSWTRIIPR